MIASMDLKIIIEQDFDPENPRTMQDNLGTLVCLHKRYTLGDKHDLRADSFASWDELRQYLVTQEGAAVILPVYMLDHSGVTVSTTPFNDPWDSGQIGWIYVSRENALKAYSAKLLTRKVRDAVEAQLRGEVETYNAYLTGGVWGYRVEDSRGEEIASCWGYYGEEGKRQAQRDAEAEAKAVEEAAEKAAEKAALPVYTVEPGRWIYRNGQPLFALQRAESASPTEIDELAYTVAALLNAQRSHNDA